MRHLPLSSLFVLACVAVSTAHAGSPIDQTRPLDARGRVEIDNLKGRVEVRAWDRQEVKVTGNLGAEVLEVAEFRLGFAHLRVPELV